MSEKADKFNKVENFLKRGFEIYGRTVAKYSLSVFLGSILVSGLLAVGMIRFHFERDVETLYTPQGSKAHVDRERIESLFTTDTTSNFVEAQLTRNALGADILFSDPGNFKNVTSFTAVGTLIDAIQNVTFVKAGFNLKFENMCAKESGKCVILGEFATTAEFHEAYLNRSLNYPVHVDKSGQFHNTQRFLGKANTQNGTVLTFEAIRISLYAAQDNQTQKSIAEEWENKILELLNDWPDSAVDIAYQVSQSMNQEVDSNTAGDFLLISLTFTVMITYACVTTTLLYRNPAMSTVATIGIAGVALAIVAAFGLVSACGLAFVNIVGVAPFLAVGKGIDDMFILMAYYKLKFTKEAGQVHRQQEMNNFSDTNQAESSNSRENKGRGLSQEEVEELVGGMFKNAGVAITVTTLTDVLAFGISASSNYISVRTFCIYTGTVLLWCYINTITIFGATVALYSRWFGNLNCAPCLTKKTSNSQNDNRSTDAKKSIFYKVFVATKLRYVILLLFAGYLGWAIWATTQMKEGLELTNLVADNSYWRNFVTTNTEYFSERGPLIQLVIDKPMNYWDSSVENEINDMISKAENSPYILNDLNITWVQNYRHFLEAFFPGNISKSVYIQHLDDFFTFAPLFQHDIVFNEERTEILASRVYVQGVGSFDNSHQVQMMLDVRQAGSDSPLAALAFSAPFVFFEQYVSILPSTLMTCGVAVAAMFVVGLILIPHPLSSFLVTTTMLMILVGMTAFMHLWGLTLSSITMIQIVLSIGFSVDFSSHVCHVFVCWTDWNDKHEDRAGKTLNKIGFPILNSAVSSILGVLLLAGARNYIFRSFFQTMFLVITLGLTHALLYLPSLLSLVGPPLRCC